MLRGEATNTNLTVFGLTRWRRKPRIYSTRGEHSNHYTTDGDANPGSTAPEASTLTITPPMVMETQDLHHQRRWKPRVYSTRGEHPNHYTTETQGLQHQRRWKPRIYSTRGEHSNHYTTETQDIQHQRRACYSLLHRWRWKRSIYSTRGEHAIHYSTGGDGNPVSTAPEASTLTITPSMVMETQDLKH